MIGVALKVVRLPSGRPTGDELLLRGVGVMLVGHVSNWMAITYFDQTEVVWFMPCAAIASITQSYVNPAVVRLRPSLVPAAQPKEVVYKGRTRGGTGARYT